jgi:CubicO group peptidase (beta-lactamase class C family)
MEATCCNQSRVSVNAPSAAAKVLTRVTRLLLASLMTALIAPNSLAASPELFRSLLDQLQRYLAPVAQPGSDSDKADFASIDDRMQRFLDESPVFDGISYVVVDASRVLHQGAFGDHTLDTVVMLASTSKVPAVMTLLALEEDPASQFRMDTPVSRLMGADGVYGDRIPSELVSNTSGIPGLDSLLLYGAHLCQFQFEADTEFETCGQTLLGTELLGSKPAKQIFDYGGSQWQLAGVAAAITANRTWNQLVDEYLTEPCELDVFTFGNMWQDLDQWNGSPDSLTGRHNPNIEGGAITTLSDYAKLLQVHLNGGYCGDQQILSAAALAEMRENRGSQVAENPTPYGMGWWISSQNANVYDDPGAFGSISFIDVDRGIGGYVAIDDYSRTDPGAPVGLVRQDIIPMIQKIIDASGMAAPALLRGEGDSSAALGSHHCITCRDPEYFPQTPAGKAR